MPRFFYGKTFRLNCLLTTKQKEIIMGLMKKENRLLTQKEKIEKHNKRMRQQKYRAIKKLKRIGRLV